MEEHNLHFYHQENINDKVAVIFLCFFQDKQFRGEIFRSSESSYFIRLYYCSTSMCFIRFFCFNKIIKRLLEGNALDKKANTPYWY